jgi:hypothetical protein
MQFGSSYNSIIGCNLWGTNIPIDSSHAPGYDPGPEFNYLLFVGYSQNGNLIEGCHFSYGWANSELTFAGASTSSGSSNNRVINNIFDHAGLYGFSVTEGDHNIFMYNTCLDANCGVEGNSGDTAATENANLLAYNKAICVVGAGNNNNGLQEGCQYFTGGDAAGVDYRGNQVFNNTLSGCASRTCSSIANAGIQLRETNGSGPANYVNNACGSGCAVH